MSDHDMRLVELVGGPLDGRTVEVTGSPRHIIFPHGSNGHGLFGKLEYRRCDDGKYRPDTLTIKNPHPRTA